MTKTLDTILLLALPASGKSEVRRYLELMPKDARLKDFHMGDSVQLDDFPYVHMMRRIDDELAAAGGKRIFFHSPERPFQDPLDWGTLIELVNEDHEDMLAKKVMTPESAGELLMERIDRAAVKVGAPARLAALDKAQHGKVAEKIEPEARKMLEEKHKGYPDTLEGKTLVIEFARGGPQTAGLPLPEPFGYRYSLAKLSPKILEKAAILYIWVTPEESRRKNSARTNPNDPGSILHHGVPIEVMLNDYGQDDMEFLLKNSERPGTVAVKAHGKTYHLPVGRFDNRVDKTSFLREKQEAWQPANVKAVHEGLREALDHLAGAAKR
jgi:hypothetical protein